MLLFGLRASGTNNLHHVASLFHSANPFIQTAARHRQGVKYLISYIRYGGLKLLCLSSMWQRRLFVSESVMQSPEEVPSPTAAVFPGMMWGRIKAWDESLFIQKHCLQQLAPLKMEEEDLGWGESYELVRELFRDSPLWAAGRWSRAETAAR